MAVIADPGHAGQQHERAASQAAADELRIRTDYDPVSNQPELDAALETARLAGAQALVVFPDSVTNAGRDMIAAYALKHGLPSVSGWDSYAEAGLLLMYGPSLSACWSRLAYYVDRILKGAAPADLPVEMTMTFETIINLKTARSLGIRIPESLLVRADRMIERTRPSGSGTGRRSTAPARPPARPGPALARILCTPAHRPETAA